MTDAQVKKLPRKNVSIDQFLCLCKKFFTDDQIDSVDMERQLSAMENGEFLGVHEVGGKRYRLHLKKVWIRTFNKKYSAHKESKSGGEILISNFPLPKGDVVS